MRDSVPGGAAAGQVSLVLQTMWGQKVVLGWSVSQYMHTHALDWAQTHSVLASALG